MDWACSSVAAAERLSSVCKSLSSTSMPSKIICAYFKNADKLANKRA